MKILGAFFSLVAACVITARADITLAPPFTDHAVLQRGQPIPVWGRADAGESIRVSFRGQSRATTADASGRWHVELTPIAAQSEPADLVVTGKNSVTLHDIVVGEVWLASGQSNMEWPLRMARDAEKEVAAATFPLIRHLRVEHTVATTPADAVKTSGWKQALPTTAGDFTAVGFFFARELHQNLHVPIGIIHSSWGGTQIEAWMSDDARNSTVFASALEERWQKARSEWPPERVARYPADMAAWQKADAEARASHTKNPLPWPQPPASDDSQARPGGLYNAMIVPLQPYALRGVLWYQGESNVGRAAEYAELLPALIRSWRDGWKRKGLAFYFVQLPNFAPDDDPQKIAWAQLREAQAKALKLPNTGMAVAIDGDEPLNLHPTKKQEIGRRLALDALALTYGQSIEWSGPQFQRVKSEDAVMRLRFKHAKGLTLRPGSDSGFQVAGVDKMFYPATAKLDGEAVILSSPHVPKPVAARYGWTNAPASTLYNAAGLPAAPFRTDDW